jgi:hypothetical protein
MVEYGYVTPGSMVVGSDSLSGSYANEIQLKNPNNQISGTFDGSGAGLTNLNASNINSGTIGNSLLQGTYGNALTLNNAANVFAGNGAGLTNLDASAVSSGTIPSARLNGTYGNPLAFTSADNHAALARYEALISARPGDPVARRRVSPQRQAFRELAREGSALS